MNSYPTMEKKLPKLKPKEAEFVEKLPLNDDNGTKTVREVYGIENDGYARVKAHRLLTKDNVMEALEIKKETLREALESKGITAEKIASKVGELLEARNGDEPNYQAIDKGITHAVKIRGDYSDEPPKATSGATYNFLFSAETQERVRLIEDEIKSQLIKPHAQEN